MKTKSKAVLVSFMLIICLMLCSFTNASSNASDELTVNNYANLYWGINIKITSSVNKVEISDDDPIINLVPKELFSKDNTTLNILGDYAYFIKTKELSKVLYKSDVILIDISTSTDLFSPDSKSQIIQTITPVFEGQYYCIDFMTYDEFNFLGNNYINQTTVSNLVTPAVDTNNNLMNETNYYLTNVSFTSFLANKQHLNPGDLNYDPNVDHGSYFIRSDLYFNGLGAKDYSDIGTYIYDSYGVALDIAIDFIPELKYLDYLSKIFNFLKVDSERLNILTRDEWRVNEEYQELYKVITYASMVEQVENYGGLVKYMSNSINSSSDGPLLFKPDSNNYVMNKFTIGTTKNWSTVINNKISFSVVDNNGNLYATSSGYSSYDLRGNEIKNIPDMNVDVEGYILLQNSDYFSFIPQYSSYYNINLDGYNVSVSLNDQKVESTNQCYYLEVDKEYIIEIMGDKPGVFNFKLSVPSLNDWSLPLAKGEYLFEFTNNSPDLYQLSFNDNVIVSILNDNFITIANLDNNPYIFLNNFTYYILIKALEDNASLNYEYVNIENVNIDQIYSNNTNQAKYYSFVADTAGYYYITEFLGNNISFYLKGDSTNVDYIVSSNSNLVRYKIYLNANDKLYLGYNNAINYKFSISLADNYISWHQDGEKITSDFIVLRQGDQTTISVYITNENVSQNLSIETYSARGITFNPVNGLLQISNDAIPTEIESAPYHLFISFDDEIYSLYVVICLCYC